MQGKVPTSQCQHAALSQGRPPFCLALLGVSTIAPGSHPDVGVAWVPLQKQLQLGLSFSKPIFAVHSATPHTQTRVLGQRLRWHVGQAGQLEKWRAPRWDRGVLSVLPLGLPCPTSKAQQRIKKAPGDSGLFISCDRFKKR